MCSSDQDSQRNYVIKYGNENSNIGIRIYDWYKRKSISHCEKKLIQMEFSDWLMLTSHLSRHLTDQFLGLTKMFGTWKQREIYIKT